jgi:hypothetical protein
MNRTVGYALLFTLLVLAVGMWAVVIRLMLEIVP